MNNLVKEDMILTINLPEKVFKSTMQPPRKFRIAMIQYPVYPGAQLVLVVEWKGVFS